MFEGGLGFQEILLTLRKAKTTTLLYQLGGKLETALAAGQPLSQVMTQFYFFYLRNYSCCFKAVNREWN